MASENAKQVVKEVLETVRKGKKVNLQKIQQKHGYSKQSAKAMKVKRTKTWHEEMDKAIPDSLLLKVHKQGLEAVKSTITGQIIPDYKTRHPYLETGYKIKGRLKENFTAIQVNIDESKDKAELLEILNKNREE